MSVITTLLSLLGDNNLVSAVIPSMALMLATLVVFDPIFKISSLLQSQNGADSLIVLGLLIIFPIIILSYTLMALNTYILKLHEGYIFFGRFPFIYNAMRNAHKNKAKKLVIQRETLRRRIEIIEKNPIQTERTYSLLGNLKQRYYYASAEYNASYPPSPNQILPTRFGNILKAAEAYPGIRYGLDGVTFWPLLIAVIPLEYRKTINDTKNELAFLVNMSFLAIVFFSFCILASLYTFINPPVGIAIYAVIDLILRYTLAGMIALCINYFFGS